jgi:hypothetical protein
MREEPHAAHAGSGLARAQSDNVGADRWNGRERGSHEREAHVSRERFNYEEREREGSAGER